MKSCKALFGRLCNNWKNLRPILWSILWPFMVYFVTYLADISVLIGTCSLKFRQIYCNIVMVCSVGFPWLTKFVICHWIKADHFTQWTHSSSTKKRENRVRFCVIFVFGSNLRVVRISFKTCHFWTKLGKI